MDDSVRPGKGASEKCDLAIAPLGRGKLGESATRVKTYVARLLVRNNMHSRCAGIAGVSGEHRNQFPAQSSTTARGRKIDMQVGRIASAEISKVISEIADIGEALLVRGILERTHKIAGDRLISTRGKQDDIRPALQITLEPAFAESVALWTGLEGAAAGPKEDGVDLGSQSCRQLAVVQLLECESIV